jgi:hypothetical protein
MNANNSAKASSSFISPMWIFIAFFTVFFVSFAVFNKEITHGYEYLSRSIKQSLGIYKQPLPVEMPPAITAPPIPPQTLTPKQEMQMNNLVEKVLPTGANEVFNVSQNKFTYYDAEPLCKSLGAELATYDQGCGLVQLWLGKRTNGCIPNPTRNI